MAEAAAIALYLLPEVLAVVVLDLHRVLVKALVIKETPEQEHLVLPAAAVVLVQSELSAQAFLSVVWVVPVPHHPLRVLPLLALVAEAAERYLALVVQVELAVAVRAATVTQLTQ